MSGPINNNHLNTQFYFNDEDLAFAIELDFTLSNACSSLFSPDEKGKEEDLERLEHPENFPIISQGTTSVSPTTVFFLPIEVLGEIFKYAVAGSMFEAANQPETAGMNTFCNIRLTCKPWLAEGTNSVFQLFWTTMKRTPDLRLQQLTEKVDAIIDQNKPPIIIDPVILIEDEMVIDVDETMVDQMETFTEDFPPMKISEAPYFPRFELLTEELRKSGAPIPEEPGLVVIRPISYLALQENLNTSLEKIWPKIRESIVYRHRALERALPSSRTTAQEIRQWLNTPENVHLLHIVKNLDLSNIQLTILPPEIRLFTQLNELNLSQNQLKRLPEVIGSCTQLKTLYLQNNELRTLPDTLGNLNQLQNLNLNNNQLTTLPRTIANLTQLNTISVSNNNLTTIPSPITALIHLNRLMLSGNTISQIPDEIGNLSRLEILDLSSNALTEISPAIGDLKELSCLHLSQNNLINIPAAVGNLPKLSDLSLKNNRLTSIPNTFGQLSELEFLDLSNNCLIHVPDTFGELTRLETLDLSHNRLTNIPDTLSNLLQKPRAEPLPSFENFSLFINSFSTFHDNSSYGPILQTLHLHGNPLIFTFDGNFLPPMTSLFPQELFSLTRAIGPGSEMNKTMISQDLMEKYTACSSYVCHSPLAALCQEIHRNGDNNALEQQFNLLPLEMQQSIRNTLTAGPSSSSDAPMNPEGTLLADRKRFAEAVFDAIRKQFAELSTSQKNLMYRQVWNLSGRPALQQPEREIPEWIEIPKIDTPKTWGETHAADNIILLIDALVMTLAPNT